MYSQLCGDRLDAERHEELQLVARLVLSGCEQSAPRGFGILTCFHQIE
jgi:hypothetical protein